MPLTAGFPVRYATATLVLRVALRALLEAVTVRGSVTYTFERVVVFSLPGVAGIGPDSTFEVSSPIGCASVRVELVNTLNDRLEHADRDRAYRSSVLKGLFNGNLDVDRELQALRDRRPDGLPRALITLSGPAKLDLSQPHRETNEFVFGFDFTPYRASRVGGTDTGSGLKGPDVRYRSPNGTDVGHCACH